MARGYKRKTREDYSEYESLRSRGYSRERKDNFRRSTYLKDEEDGYHFHIDLNLNKEIIGKFGRVAKKLFGGILDYVDPEDDYEDRERFTNRRDRRAIGSNGYPEKPRRRY